MQKPKTGMIGLAVMGSNLAMNIESRGVPCAVYNRSFDVTEDFMKKNQGKQFVASKSLQEFVQSMDAPRQVFLMVKAGAAVDNLIESLIPLLTKGDILIDGGNSHYSDTNRREERCLKAGLNFLGLGVSGGEEGARFGPSLMPGGPYEAWKIVAPVLEKIAAVADGPCTTYIGPGGSGHFVKMVHNGIEYGDMQLIAEAYQLLKDLLGLNPPELAQIFNEWNQGVLSSFLIEITSKIFTRKDDQAEGYLVDKILDKAGQKGTGKWTSETALELGVSIPTLAAAVDARVLSSLKEQRLAATNHFPFRAASKFSGDKASAIASVHDALYCSKIMAYAQGMALIQAASLEWKWNLNLSKIAAIWKGGCIIRARFLDDIRRAFEATPELNNLILDKSIKTAVLSTSEKLRKVVAIAAEQGIPIPAFSASLAYYDSYRSAHLPQNLTQAQRDFFGAHTFERKDKPGTFHAKWS